MPPKDNEPNAPYVTEEQPSFSFLGTFSKFAVIGGGIVAAIAFGGPHLATLLDGVDKGNTFKGMAETVSEWAKSSADTLGKAGTSIIENAQLKDYISNKTAIAVAGAIGAGVIGAGVSSFAHAGDNSTSNSTLPNALAHTAAHAAAHTLST
jgi:hypothetical protein